jgi:MOSC domain-containing protein YiiM
MTIRHIYISPAHIFVGHHGKPAGDTPMKEVAEVECVAGKGLKGDRYFAFKQDYKGQVTFFSEEVYERLCEQMQVTDKDPSVFRRNIIVRGVDLNSLIGTEFEVQGVRFIGTQEAAPCYWMNQAFGEGAEQKLKGNGGLRARILSDGVLRRDS